MIETIECSNSNFWYSNLTSSEKCVQLAYGSCEEYQEMVNFFAFFWCYLDGSIAAYAILSLIFIFLIFKFISSTIEEFCAPSITFLCEWLKLSEALAAVTLLAFANGAADVITAIVASRSTNGISYNIGSLYGAGLFACALVISLIIFKSNKDIVVTPSCVYRDIGIYIFSTAYILAVAAFGEITVAISASLLLIYAALVTIVIFQDYLAAKESFGKETKVLKNSCVRDSSDSGENKIESTESDREDHFKSKKKEHFKNIGEKIRHHFNLLTVNIKTALEAKFKYREEQHYKKFKQRTTLDKIWFAIDFPFDILRRLTIPPCEPDHFHKVWLLLWPFPGLFLCAWIFTGGLSTTCICVIIPLASILTVVFFFTCPKNGLPKYIAILEILGLFMSIIWTYIVLSTLIDLLEMWTVFSGISATYMGLTIVAFGTALPDAFSMLALSKIGYGDMAIIGNYSSQCFGFLVGFGLAMLKKTLSSGTQVFNLFNLNTFNSNYLDITVVITMLLVLCVSFIYGIVNKFHFDRLFAKVLIAIYVFFYAIATVFAIILLVLGKTA